MNNMQDPVEESEFSRLDSLNSNKVAKSNC